MKEKNSNNDIRISVEFLESGMLLNDSSTEIHRYTLDLDVPRELTCDAFLGAIYAGIRSILTERYQLDVLENQSAVVYQELLDQMEARGFDPKQGKWFLRERVRRDVRLRTSVLSYASARKKLYQKSKICTEREYRKLDSETQERIRWQVCWQVFLECFHAYAKGYPEEAMPNSQMTHNELFRRHPSIIGSSIHADPIENPLRMLSRKKDGSRTLRELGFVSGSRIIFDPVLWHQSDTLFEGNALKKMAAVQQETLLLESGHADPYVIPVPGKMPEPGNIDLPMVVLPSILLMMAVVGVWVVAGLYTDSMQILLLAAAMVIGTLLSATLNRKILNRSFDMRVQNWRLDYEQTVRRYLDKLKQEQARDVLAMERAFPPAWSYNEQDLVHRAASETVPIQERRPGGKDFLKVRLGRSGKESKLVLYARTICTEPTSAEHRLLRFRNLPDSGGARFSLALPDDSRPEEVEDDLLQGTVNELGAKLNNLFAYLKNAPVLLELERLRALGLVSMNGWNFLPFITNLTLDLCYHQRPEDLQMVILFEPTRDLKEQADRIHRFKALPHFCGLFRDRAAFSFSREDSWEIFDRLHRICLERSAGGQDIPHIVVVMLHDYDFSKHPLSEWQKEDYRRSGNGAGMTLVISGKSRFDFPDYCPTMIRVDSDKKWYLIPVSHLNRAEITGETLCISDYGFRPDAMAAAKADRSGKRDQDPYSLAFRALGAKYYGVNPELLPPSYLELFRIVRNLSTGKSAADVTDAAADMRDMELAYLLQRHLKELIEENWKAPFCQDLRVPIGRGAEEDVYLDLREEQDGNHLLITGEPGSGKTSAVLTLLLQLCIRFGPEALKIDLVDMGGHELLKALGELPHVRCGLRLDSQNIQTVRTEMCSLLDSIRQELLQRQMRLMAQNCRTIDLYNQKVYREKSGDYMAHLFLVIDHYDLLDGILRGSDREPDRMELHTELTKLLHAAKGTGLHLIVLSKYPELSIPDQFAARLQTHLCLKVSDELQSFRLIGTGDAAGIRIPGRAYLRRRNSTFPEPVQIAYAEGDIIAKKGFSFKVSLAEPGGAVVPFFDSDAYIAPGIDEEIRLCTVYDPDCHSNVNKLGQHQKKKYRYHAFRDFEVHQTSPATVKTPSDQAEEEPLCKKGRTAEFADLRPDWWGEEEQSDATVGAVAGTDTVRSYGNADPRPDWWYEEEQSDATVGAAAGTDTVRSYGNADPRPNWWYEEEQSDATVGAAAGTDTVRSYGNADHRPNWWYEEEQKSSRSKETVDYPHADGGNRVKQGADHAGKRYSYHTTGGRSDIRKKRNERRADRYFRPSIEGKEAQWVVLPRPDQSICERKPIGLTQSQCLTGLMSAGKSAPEPETAAVR